MKGRRCANLSDKLVADAAAWQGVLGWGLELDHS